MDIILNIASNNSYYYNVESCITRLHSSIDDADSDVGLKELAYFFGGGCIRKKRERSTRASIHPVIQYISQNPENIGA